MHSGSEPGAPPPLASIMEHASVGLFLDFDGTLVELAPGPDAIKPLPDLAVRLAALSDRLGGACAIVSGRAIVDIERHLGPLPVAIAGSHGSDIRTSRGETLGEGARALPDAIEAQLRAFAEAEDLDYEHKPHGGALHYRRNPAGGPRAHAFAEVIAAEHGWVTQSGKFVVELVAAGANKGSAVSAFLFDPGPFAGSLPIFVGDDLTDEAGFEVCARLGGCGVLVGERRETAARFRLPDVAAVHDWLEL